MDMIFEQEMAEIISAIRDAGFTPYEQIYGYLQTEDAIYITRKNNARTRIQALDQAQIRKYIERMR